MKFPKFRPSFGWLFFFPTVYSVVFLFIPNRWLDYLWPDTRTILVAILLIILAQDSITKTSDELMSLAYGLAATWVFQFMCSWSGIPILDFTFACVVCFVALVVYGSMLPEILSSLSAWHKVLEEPFDIEW
jgi:hypothetical protein